MSKAPATSLDDPRDAPEPVRSGPGGRAFGSFDEEVYLRLNPDVLLAVAAGKFRSGRDHYERFGRIEGRPTMAPGSLPRDRVVITADANAQSEKPRAPAGAIDAVKLSASGAILVIGWVNDVQDRVDALELHFQGWSVAITGANLARLRRPDAEAALGGSPHSYGFWGFLYAARRLTGGPCAALLRLKSGAEISVQHTVELMDDVEMRNVALTHLAHAEYLGNAYFASTASLEAAIGDQLLDFNKMLTRRAVNAPYDERFGQTKASYKGSIIVCLYGKPEYMFLQQALFSQHPGMADYEFIYVNNSPEIAEALLKEARRCHRIYGLDMTLVLLNANAGFGAANNIGAKYANSDRLLIVNPDVFPYHTDWTARHNAIVEQLPPAQTTLFGAPLFYDDSSLMHGGMYFDLDTAPNFSGGRRTVTSIMRVEHYGKGAPPGTAAYLKPRIVPAVTGAFMSVKRAWFEEMDGFTEDYIFGHYEDADLCLKSLEAGVATWLHDVRFFHLEGKGSTRKPPHEGGSIVNRWLFTRNWAETVSQGLLGPNPTHPVITGEAPLPPPDPEPEPEPEVVEPKSRKRGRAS
jgi:GT2 family glycosyltransferase